MKMNTPHFPIKGSFSSPSFVAFSHGFSCFTGWVFWDFQSHGAISPGSSRASAADGRQLLQGEVEQPPSVFMLLTGCFTWFYQYFTCANFRILMEHIALLMEGKPVKPLIDQQSYSWVDIVRLVHPTGLRPRLAPASCKLMLVLVKLWNTYCIVKAPCFFLGYCIFILWNAKTTHLSVSCWVPCSQGRTSAGGIPLGPIGAIVESWSWGIPSRHHGCFNTEIEVVYDLDDLGYPHDLGHVHILVNWWSKESKRRVNCSPRLYIRRISMIKLTDLSKWFMVIQYYPKMLVWMIVIWINLNIPTTYYDITHTLREWVK